MAPARFGLVLEGVRSRTELQERMVRLLTAGLTPARGAALDIPLQFHLACVLLSERVMTPALLLRDLDRLLASMSPRTRRPIRFLDPDDSRGPPRNNPTDGGAPAGTVSSQSGSSGPDSAGPGAMV
jgi:hypothetical protein